VKAFQLSSMDKFTTLFDVIAEFSRRNDLINSLKIIVNDVKPRSFSGIPDYRLGMEALLHNLRFDRVRSGADTLLA
jgi:hypothetical protein